MLAALGRTLQRLGTALAPPIKNQAAMYPAATQGRRARGWFSSTLGPNDSTLPSLSLLRARSRAGVRTDGYARTAVDRLVSNLIGTGIEPQSLAPDQNFQERVEQLWLDWTDEADADGRLDLYGLQALAVRGWLEGGEMFVRLRPRLAKDGLAVPLQLQLLEPELCPENYSTVGSLGNVIRAGIEFDPLGRRAAYWFYRRRPSDFTDIPSSELVPVPADSVIHLYDPLRAGQIRGVPQLTQALLKLYDLDQYDDATLVRQKLANLFVGFLKRGGPTPDAEVDPLTGQAIERDDAGHGLIGLEPGLFQELNPGEEVDFSEPPDAAGYADFMRAQLMGAAVAADVPYEVLTGDLRAVNDRTVRVILNEFRRRVEQRQHHIVAFALNRPVWTAFVNAAVISGALAVPAAFHDDPRPWLRVEWVPPAWPYLHPVQDVEAERAMVLAGFKSRSQVVRERGWRARQVEREIADDNARADALGFRLHSDSRFVDAKGAAPAGGPPASDTGQAALALAQAAVERPAPAVIVQAPLAPAVHAPITVVVPEARPMREDFIRDPETKLLVGRVQRPTEERHAGDPHDQGRPR
ncbi:MAG TPA: phage portal protein [Methylomirabilota bacterium]|jgi:lambda family phage portal protein|nr:phage portal protein [Methylomirabilota bacterium]